MNKPLDPWNDAERIASRLREPGAELWIVIGAEAWCDKCRRLRPLFDGMPQPAKGAALWLDLEDHAEFLGGFIPEDLPMLLRWRDGTCVEVAVIDGIEQTHGAPWRRSTGVVAADVPELWTGFAQGRWR